MKNYWLLIIISLSSAGCISPHYQMHIEMSEIIKNSDESESVIPGNFFIIDRNCRLLNQDELSEDMISTLQTLSNYQIESSNVEEVKIDIVLEEVKKRLQRLNLTSLQPELLDDANNNEVSFMTTDISILFLYEIIALSGGNHLWLDQNGQLIITSTEDEFHQGLPCKYQSGGYIVLKEEKTQKEKRQFQFIASVQGIIAGRNKTPMAYSGIQKYYLPKLKEFRYIGNSPLIAVEETPYVELLIILEEGNDFFTFDTILGSLTRNIALHEYKKYFGDINPIGKRYNFTIESTEYGDGSISYKLIDIKPAK